MKIVVSQEIVNRVKFVGEMWPLSCHALKIVLKLTFPLLIVDVNLRSQTPPKSNHDFQLEPSLCILCSDQSNTSTIE